MECLWKICESHAASSSTDGQSHCELVNTEFSLEVKDAQLDSSHRKLDEINSANSHEI